MLPPHLRHFRLLRPLSGHPVRLRPEPAVPQQCKHAGKPGQKPGAVHHQHQTKGGRDGEGGPRGGPAAAAAERRAESPGAPAGGGGGEEGRRAGEEAGEMPRNITSAG